MRKAIRNLFIYGAVSLAVVLAFVIYGASLLAKLPLLLVHLVPGGLLVIGFVLLIGYFLSQRSDK